MVARFLFAVLLIFAGPALAQSAPAPKPSVVVGPAKKSTITAATPAPDDRARQWLVLVDDKNYAQSWSEAGKAFQSHQKPEAWARDAAATRAPLGAVASRGLKSIDLSRGNTAVIRYETVFAHKAAAVETISLAFENGSWSVTEYSVN